MYMTQLKAVFGNVLRSFMPLRSAVFCQPNSHNEIHKVTYMETWSFEQIAGLWAKNSVSKHAILAAGEETWSVVPRDTSMRVGSFYEMLRQT